MSINDLHARFLKMAEETERYDVSDVNGKVLIVDGLNSYIRCFAAVPTMNEDGDHMGGVTGFLKSIGKAIRTFRPTRVIIAFDGRGGSQRRRKIFPDYKENRRTMNRLNRTYEGWKNKEEENQSRHYQLITLAQILSYLPVTVMAPSNVEADDVIAYIAHLIEERDGQAIIMSTDKDFLQIVSDNVELYNPIKKKSYGVDDVLDEYGIHPNNFAVFRAMDGDKSDNIPGVRGVGRKLLVRNFPQLGDEQKVDIDEILEFAGEQKKGKLFESIHTNRKLIERNYEIMQLADGMMSGQTRLDVLDRVDNYTLQLNRDAMTAILANNKIMDAFGNYPQWVQLTFAPLMRYTVKQ